MRNLVTEAARVGALDEGYSKRYDLGRRALLAAVAGT